MTEPSDPHRDLAGVLHDVSNALTVVLGWAGEARSADATAETTAYALSIVEQYARIARDLARHAIGNPRVDAPREIGALIDEVTRALAIEATRSGVRLAVEAESVRAKVAGGLDVCQVLTNLVLNALAHAPKGSLVTIACTVDDVTCCIEVRDEGAGVPASRRDDIFHGASMRPGGTGVGLRHSRALARACGGDVELIADEGQGARFRITWPRVDATPRPPTSVSRMSSLEGMRVLVVEDDRAVTQLLEVALEARGAQVSIAATAAEFATVREQGRYDAALFDLSPIVDDVPGAISAFRASSPLATVILMTGSADAIPMTLADESVELLRKPFEIGELLARLARSLVRPNDPQT